MNPELYILTLAAVACICSTIVTLRLAKAVTEQSFQILRWMTERENDRLIK